MKSQTAASPYTAARVETAHGIAPPEPRRGRAIRTVMRSLTDHAKEALVVADDGPAWRLFSDEGDYFGGTDLAPPPLGLFSAGLAACYVDELRALAARRGVTLHALRVIEDSVYTTEGSALRGTIAGGALPVEVRVEADTPDRDEMRALAREAIASAAVDGLLRRPLTGRFALYLNGERIATGDVPETDGPALNVPPSASATRRTDGPRPSRSSSRSRRKRTASARATPTTGRARTVRRAGRTPAPSARRVRTA